MLKRKLMGNYDSEYKMKRSDNDSNISIQTDNSNTTSKYFKTCPLATTETVCDKMLQLQCDLNETLKTLDLKTAPIEYIYNPLAYAFDTYEKYVRKYCSSNKSILFVGMNPGPFGMCQTGVPFGDPKCVKEFLQIEGLIKKPEVECPSRKILGFDSLRREQSGERFWGFFQNLCGTPDIFFKNAFILNFCPIALMKQNGCNVTPADIKNIKVRKSLEAVCEDWYIKVIGLLQPKFIIAIGTYTQKKTKDLLEKHKVDNVKVLYMPHPSPRVVNNNNWHEKAQMFLEENQLIQYFSK